MDRLREVFKNNHLVLPVIHVEDLSQALSNIAVAKEAGADGVFLINHKIPYQKLLDIYYLASVRFLGFWMGINLLDLAPFRVFDKVFKGGLRVEGIWVDNARIDEFGNEQNEPLRIKDLIHANKWNGLYFGGIAFKYQRPAYNLEKLAKIAARYMDVVTTSGPATGQAASVEKIRLISQAISGKPLAIASGITPENVKDYLKLANCFLVATGISSDFYTLDEAKTKRLVEKVRRVSR